MWLKGVSGRGGETTAQGLAGQIGQVKGKRLSLYSQCSEKPWKESKLKRAMKANLYAGPE